MVNSVYLTLSCRGCRLCLYIYFLKVFGFFWYAICQRPSRYGVPQSSLRAWICLQRSWAAPGCPALPKGGCVRMAPRARVQGLSLLEHPGCQTRGIGSPVGAGPPGPHAEQFFSTLLLHHIRAHHHPERPLPDPPRSQPRSSSREERRTAGASAHGAGATHL